MDDIDRRLLKELQSDARLSLSELGRRVGLSSSATADRLRRLEETGVIVGYRAEIDPKAVGYDLAAVLRIRPMIGQLKQIVRVANDTPEVMECHRVTGEDCYIMKVVFGSIDDLEELIDRFTPFGQTTTSIINASPVPPRGVPI